MVKTFAEDKQQAKQKPEPAVTRRFVPEEFEADTTEERSVALLAERRRRFLVGLKASCAESHTM